MKKLVVGKSNVAVMAGAPQLEDIDTGKKTNQDRYIKARVLESHAVDEINRNAANHLMKSAFF